jgi:hypothetical protein
MYDIEHLNYCECIIIKKYILICIVSLASVMAKDARKKSSKMSLLRNPKNSRRNNKYTAITGGCCIGIRIMNVILFVYVRAQVLVCVCVCSLVCESLNNNSVNVSHWHTRWGGGGVGGYSVHHTLLSPSHHISQPCVYALYREMTTAGDRACTRYPGGYKVMPSILADPLGIRAQMQGEGASCGVSAMDE